MEITWYGYNCFGLKTKDGAMIVDPYKNDVGLKLPALKGNVVIVSDQENQSNNAEGVSGDPKILTLPGEYEVSGIAITGMELSESKSEEKSDKKKSASSSSASTQKKSRIYSFDADGLKVCYITDFVVPLTEDQLETIGDVDVLVAPVRGNLEELHKSIEEIEPRIVIPISYKTGGLKAEAGDLETFLKKNWHASRSNLSPKIFRKQPHRFTSGKNRIHNFGGHTVDTRAAQCPNPHY